MSLLNIPVSVCNTVLWNYKSFFLNRVFKQKILILLTIWYLTPNTIGMQRRICMTQQLLQPQSWMFRFVIIFHCMWYSNFLGIMFQMISAQWAKKSVPPWRMLLIWAKCWGRSTEPTGTHYVPVPTVPTSSPQPHHEHWGQERDAGEDLHPGPQERILFFILPARQPAGNSQPEVSI